MDKLMYWLKKLGILRTSSYSVKGEASKLAEMDAKDGGMIQSQKEIDEEYKKKLEQKQDQEQEKEEEKEGENDQGKTQDQGSDMEKQSSVSASTPPESGSPSGGKVLFWIFAVVALFFVLVFSDNFFSIWTLLAVLMWGFFLRKLWVSSVVGTLAVGKMIGLGILVIFLSMVLAMPNIPEDVGADADKDIKDGKEQMQDDEVVTDKVTKFLLKLQKETKIEFSDPVDDDLSWPAGDISLGLNKSKSFASKNLSSKDFDRIQEFFIDQDANDGGLGFTFVPPAGTQSSGFALPTGEYTGLMCVLVAIEEDGVLIGCGWGPGGEK